MIYRGEADEAKRRMGISLVLIDPKNGKTGGKVMEEEIFGPVLPIVIVEVSWHIFRIEVRECADL